MSSEWRNIAFGDFIALQRGHDLPDQSRRPGIVPILGSFGVTGFHDTVKALAPGVTIGRSGGSFGVAVYTEKDYWPLNTALYVTDFKENHPKFVFYFLKIFDFSGYNSGSAQPSLNRNNLYGIQIKVPPKPIQKNIADFVSALDDRISTLHETNTALEAIAQAIFKSWFVDFDPVHAKLQGIDPDGVNADSAALFPNSFDESKLGMVPMGWRHSRLGDEVSAVLGGTPSRVKPEFWGGKIPWINSGKVNEFRITEPTEFITKSGLDSSSTKMLPARTTVIAITGATLGQISLTEIETCANQSVVGVIGTEAIPNEFIYFWIKEHIEDLLSWQTGGAQQHINKNNVNDLPILCPDKKVISAFVDAVRPLFDRIKIGCIESGTLTTLRDTLLPRLISGQLRLPEAGPLIEELH